MEVWKKVENTNGMIEISNFGRVRSLLSGKPYILKTCPDKKGYHRLRITIDRKKYLLSYIDLLQSILLIIQKTKNR